MQRGDEVCILLLRVMDSHICKERYILRMNVASNLTVCCHLYLGCQGTHAHGFFFFDLKKIPAGDCVSCTGLELVLGTKFPSGRSLFIIQLPIQVGTTVDHFNVNVSSHRSNFS